MKRNYVFIIIALLFALTSCNFEQPLPCEHIFKEYKTISSTCSENGKYIEVCIKCNEKKETVLEKEEHEYEQFEISSTCKEEGKVYEVCKNCSHEHVINTIEKLKHEFNETIFEPTCLDDGYTLKECINCDFEEKIDIIKALDHKLSSWETVIEPTDMKDGLRKRSCLRCDYVEEVIILSSAYIDLSVIKEKFDSSLTYEIDSYDKLLILFECAIFNRASILCCNINYSFDSLQNLIDSLMDDKNITSSFEVHVEYSGTLLTFGFTYNAEPTLSTTNIYYTQYESLNLSNIDKKRSDDFDDFEINNSVYSYNVETSDQLFYVLERGVKPLCKDDSTAELLYKELKKVLINVINDDMNDLEKVKAIYDYLVMNTVYDNELLLRTMQGDTNLKSYKGFYLEGVLFDKKAVCEGISKTFTALCNIEGIPCVTVEGYQTKNPNGVGHVWNKVYINNNWYIVDATSGGTIINESFEVLTYKYFLVSEEIYQEKYTGEMFLDLECNSVINVYEKMFFTYNEQLFDYNIDSQEELDVIIAYFEKANIKNSTIEFKINFDYGDSFMDEINLAYQNNHISASFYYIDNINSLMLIKG